MRGELLRFVRRMALFLGIALALLLALGLSEHPVRNGPDYMAAIIDKHARLDTVPPPRVLLVGGSNLAFGVDSRAMEEALGVPVINMGLHAGLGFTFMLNEVRSVMRKGDRIVLSPEYFLEAHGDDDLLRNTVRAYPSAAVFFTKNYLTELAFFLRKKQRSLKRLFGRAHADRLPKINAVYTRAAFNDHGDVVSHLERTDRISFANTEPLSYRHWEGIAAINDLQRSAKKAGAEVVYVFPNYPASEYRKNEQAIARLEVDLRAELQVPLLNNPQDLVYPDSLFFDAVYHLNQEGRAMRTRALTATLLAMPGIVATQ